MYFEGEYDLFFKGILYLRVNEKLSVDKYKFVEVVFIGPNQE